MLATCGSQVSIGNNTRYIIVAAAAFHPLRVQLISWTGMAIIPICQVPKTRAHARSLKRYF